MAAKRACKGTTKAGKPCGAYPLKDAEVCLAHADADKRTSVGFVPEAGHLGGRPRRPTVIEAIREEVERRTDEIVGKLWGLANTAERAVVVGNGPGARVEIVPDYDLRLKALRELLDRSHGRPKQATEISGPGGGAIPTAPEPPAGSTWREDALRAAAEIGLLHEPAVPMSEEVAAANGSRNGHG